MQIDYIISSPFERAVHTILPLSEQINQEIHIENRLRERVLCSQKLENWMEELRKTYDDLDYKLPGGESSREAMDRGLSVINELLLTQYNHIVVVTHGNLLSLILKNFDKNFGFDEWMRLTNPDIYIFESNSAGKSIKRLWE